MNARDYLFEREPVRHALVVGNGDYEHLGPLHSATLDAKRMARCLAQLRFTTTLVPRLPSVREFEEEILPAFRKTIQRGDLVVFYFSGHGFEYGPHNYIAPANVPIVVTEQTIAEYAIAVESIEDYLARQSPGLILMLIDACRTIAGFVIKESGARRVVRGGVDRHIASPERVNIIEAFAARAGNAALGSNAGATLSPFTKSLCAHIGTKGVELSTMLKDVAADVLLATNQEQSPGVVSWATCDVFLDPSETIREQEKEAWLAALSANSSEDVQRFAYRYALSRHAAAAWQWLEDGQRQSNLL